MSDDAVSKAGGSLASGTQPAQAAPGGVQPPDRTRGHSSARDAREQAAGLGAPEQPIRVGDQDYDHETVRNAIAAKVEGDARRAALPQSPDGYELKLPGNFQAPEGMQFEFRKDDPALKRAQEIALARGLDQETFSDLLGTYAGNKIQELQELEQARKGQLEKLGGAGEQRIDAVSTWLKAKVGSKADVLVSQMKNYPSVPIVETFETIIRLFSSQGGSQFDQRHRESADQNAIPNYENMTFEQRRLHQMAQQEQRRAAERQRR